MPRQPAFIDQLRMFRCHLGSQDPEDRAQNETFLHDVKNLLNNRPEWKNQVYIRALQPNLRVCLVACLRTAHLTYVTVGGEETGYHVSGRSPAREDEETFALVHQQAETVALRTIHNTFVSAEDAKEGYQVIANRTEAKQWESFRLLPDNTAKDGKCVPGLFVNQGVALAIQQHVTLVSAEDRRTNFRLIANRQAPNAGDWEKFTLTEPDLEVLERFCSPYHLDAVHPSDV